MAVSAGTASLQVVPQLAKQFSRDLVTQMAGPANRAADRTGRQAGQRLGRQLEHAGDDSARRYGVRFNKRLGAGFSTSTKIASVAAGAIGGAFAAVQIGGFLKGAIEEAREAAKVGRQTAAVIKATGGVAKVSAGDVDKLADRLSGLAGVDDEVIATGANMLLTFKNVRSEVGKGNNIFEQASVAALDMTAAMGKGVVTQEGLQASTIRLGKALNDPLKGMTALTKVGVTFTAGQRKQIKALVEAGDIMGAQKIILKELATEFGGAAKAAADPWQRVGVVMGNVKEDIGTLLLPAISAAATFITDKLVPGVRGFAEKHGPAFRDVFNDIKTAVSNFFTAVKDNLEPQLARIKQAWDDNREALGLLIGEFDKGTGSAEAGEDAVKSFGDAMVGLITTAGNVSSAMKTAEGYINGFNDTLADVGNAIHRIFVVPIYQAFQDVVNAALFANQKMIAGAATVAEALHLPMAAGLRKAEQRLGGFKGDFNQTMDFLKNKSETAASQVPGGNRSRFGSSLRAAEAQMRGFRGSFNASIGQLHGKRITIPIKGTFQPPKGFSMHSIVGATGGLVTPTAIVHRAQGGPIRMGTGPTADDVPAMLSRGEYVINAKATAKHRGLVEAINRDGLPGLARGGDVETGVKVPSMGRFSARIQQVVDTVGRKTAAALQKRLRIDLGGAIGGGSGPGGWQWQMRVLRAAFPGLQLISGFRPGAITATGNRSYHSMGRAVDIPPRRDVFNWIRGTYGRNTRELIFSPAGNLQVHNGQNHMYTGVTRGDHWDHVHWAYDKGGWLPPGTSMAVNRTGQPERVLGPSERIPSADEIGRAVAEHLAAQPVVAVTYLDGRRVDKQLATAKVWNERR